MKHLEIVMIGEPKGSEFYDLRKTGKGMGVKVDTVLVHEPWRDVRKPLYALETWQGPTAHDLSMFQFPERMVLITGTTNRGLDEEWREVVDGSIYIDQGYFDDGTFLSVPAAGAMVMWEFHKQRSAA